MTLKAAKASSENISSRFHNYDCKMYSKYPGIKLGSVVSGLEEQFENLLSSAHFHAMTAKQLF